MTNGSKEILIMVSNILTQKYGKIYLKTNNMVFDIDILIMILKILFKNNGFKIFNKNLVFKILN
jgi:hypothetical protein